MFGGLLGGGGSAKSPGSSSFHVNVIEIILNNFIICFFMTSCRLELSIFCISVCSDDNVLSFLWFASSSFKAVVSSTFSYLFNFVWISSLSSLMSLLSAFDFIFWLLGAFWLVPMVFTRVELMSQSPNCLCSSYVCDNVPFRLFECGVNVPCELWILYVSFIMDGRQWDWGILCWLTNPLWRFFRCFG